MPLIIRNADLCSNLTEQYGDLIVYNGRAVYKIDLLTDQTNV